MNDTDPSICATYEMMQTYSSSCPLCLMDTKWVEAHIRICSVEQMLRLYEANRETLRQLLAEVMLDNKMSGVFRAAKIEGKGLHYRNENNAWVTISAEDMTEENFNAYVSTQDFSSVLDQLKETDVNYAIDSVIAYIQT